jgi:hypothetical protein
VRPTSLPVAEASGLPYDRLIGSDEFPNALIDKMALRDCLGVFLEAVLLKIEIDFLSVT